MAIALGSCARPKPAERMITVSIEPQSYLLEQIVGERFTVACMLSSGSNPEVYEPSINHLMNLERSEAYFCIGNIGFELAIVDKARSEYPSLRVYDNSRGVEMLHGSHSAGSQDGSHSHEVDPHIWTSVPNAVVIARNMTDAVIELDPGNADEYEANYASLRQQLESLDAELRQQLAPVAGQSFLVWHPSLSYFARDYGLNQISLEHEGKEAPVGEMKAKIDEARLSGATVLFFQKEFDSRQISTINQQIGATMVTINPMSHDWEKEMRSIANALVAK